MTNWRLYLHGSNGYQIGVRWQSVITACSRGRVAGNSIGHLKRRLRKIVRPPPELIDY